jgi:predicted DNA-binding protein (UPF0251 family)
MKAKNKIRKPFRRGSCRTCREAPYVTSRTLCPVCKSFVDQDYGAQNASLITSKDLERIAEEKQDLWKGFRSPEIENNSDETRSKYTVSYLTQAGLSPCEKKTIKLVFLEQRTHETVAKLLRVTRGSVYKTVERARAKLEICLARALLSKGEGLLIHPCSTPPASTIQTKSRIAQACARVHLSFAPIPRPAVLSDIEPIEYTRRASLRRVCPRCHDRVFCADRDFQYCFNCLWESDSEAGLT